MKFADLVQSMTLDKDTDDFTLPGQQQREAARQFEHLFHGRGIALWNPNRKPALDEVRIVIGVSTASRRDMQFLDELQVWAELLRRNGIRIEAFNVYYFQTPNEFEIRIPGLGKVYQTPVAGIWEQGEWMERATGYAARVMVLNYIRRLSDAALERLVGEKIIAEKVAA